MGGVVWGIRAVSCRNVLVATVALVTGAVSIVPVRADPKVASLPHAGAGNFMRVFGQATAPYGWAQFCQANPAECREWRTTESRVSATMERMAELDTLNRAINAAIQPATDLEVYGVTEYWTLPATRGDCEDYALLKRKVLIERGWPAGALLMTVVRDETGDGHAVLTVRTSNGDYVLDNKVSEIRLWSETPYTFVMRQSYLNPNVWVTLAPGPGTEPAAIAGVRKQAR